MKYQTEKNPVNQINFNFVNTLEEILIFSDENYSIIEFAG